MSSQADPVRGNEAETLQDAEDVERNRQSGPEEANNSSPDEETVGAHSNDGPLSLSGDAAPNSANASTAPTALDKTESGGPQIDDNEEDEGDDDEEDEEEDDDDFPRFEDATPRGRIVSSVSGQKPGKPRPK